MLWIVFTVVAAIHIAFLVLSLRLRAGLADWLVRALLLGMIADNVIVAAGAFAFDASWYPAASSARFYAHVILLPPLVLAALDLLNRIGSEWGSSSALRALALVFVVAAIGWGYVTELSGLELQAETVMGHTRYVSTHAAPPLATIATNLVLLVLAGFLWKGGSWPWLSLATIAIFVVNGATAMSDYGVVAGNLAETVFAAGWIASLYRFRVD